MPHIIVTGDRATDTGEATVMFRERVSARDFESQHFSKQLVERIGWAVGDADALEREPAEKLEPEREPEPVREPEPQPEPEPEPMPMPALSPVLPQAW